MGSMADAMLACRTSLSRIATVEDKRAASDAIDGKSAAKLGKVLADAIDEPGVVVPDDNAVGREDLECGLGVGFDALVGVAAVDEAEVGVAEEVWRREGEGVSAELVDAGCGGVILEGEASGGAGEPDPLLIAAAKGFDLGFGILLGKIEGVDLGVWSVERQSEGADAAEGSGFEDLLRSERAGDGCEESIGKDEAEAGQADGVDGREDDLSGFVAAERCGEGGVVDRRKRVSGVEGMLADVAAKLNNVAAGLFAGDANGQ